MKRKLTYKEMANAVRSEPVHFPKYVSPLINLANQYAQGTRPRVVGQMTELIQEFPGENLEEWEAWYRERHPEAIEEATDKIWEMVRKLKEATGEIDRETVRDWVEDLVLVKTFVGLHFQEAVLQKVAEERDVDYRLATPQEESKGIDGIVGETPVSIKPSTYKSKAHLSEEIDCDIIYYDKKSGGITIEFSV